MGVSLVQEILLFTLVLTSVESAGGFAFVVPVVRNQRSPHHGASFFSSSTTSSSSSSLFDHHPQPRAALQGYISPTDLPAVITALEGYGFDTSHLMTTPPQQLDGHVYRYTFVKASGMLKLVQAPTPNYDDDNNNNLLEAPPKWIPIMSGKEHVLIKNGWSFLDPDESEPLSAYDVDAANKESQYKPQWGRSQSHEDGALRRLSLSNLGYSIVPYSKAQILEEAAAAIQGPTLSVLLDGATDPPQRKTTHNGYNFQGSVKDLATQGIFTCAIGGLPLFTTLDLSPSGTATSGWLSFVRPISSDHIVLVTPQSDNDEEATSSTTITDRRIEVLCAQTRCHLGHYFGKTEGYCINASALNFHPTTTSTDANNNERTTATTTTNHQSGGEFALPLAPPVSFRSLEAFSKQQEWCPGTKLLQDMVLNQPSTETVVLGAGCFWHVEFALRRLPGVLRTRVGYAGGGGHHPSPPFSTSSSSCRVVPPTYEEVCEGSTGHAEVVKVDFVSSILPPKVLFDCFLSLHDPTKTRAHAKHAQGTGQYRSCIFVPASTSSELMTSAQQALQECQSQLGRELSTELRMMVDYDDDDNLDAWFHEAEERHQQHDEKRMMGAAAGDLQRDLSTLEPSEWLAIYGKRSKSEVGSSETLLAQ